MKYKKLNVQGNETVVRHIFEALVDTFNKEVSELNPTNADILMALSNFHVIAIKDLVEQIGGGKDGEILKSVAVDTFTRQLTKTGGEEYE